MAIGISGFQAAPTSTSLNRSDRNLERISSGQQINRASDNAAGLATSERLGREIDGLGVAIRNAGDGISYSQVGSGGLENLRNDFSRIRELALQAGNGTLNSSDRQALQKESDQLLGNIRQNLQNTNFNGQSLFNSDEDVSFQVGSGTGEGSSVSVGPQNLNRQLQDSGALSVDLSDPQAAAETISRIDGGLETINETDSTLGAVANRLESSVNQLRTQQQSAAEARSRIADTDIAKEASNLISNQIREQAELAVQSQANGQSRYVLSLLS